MPKKNLNQNFIDRIPVQVDKYKIDYFDTSTKGLSLKVLSSGAKNYYFRFKNARDKYVEKKIGDAKLMSLVDARLRVQELVADISRGDNPFDKKAQLKLVPTFAQFINEYYLPHIKGYKKSWDTDVSLLNNHLLPVLGKKHLDQVTKRELVGLFAKHRESHEPASTNRVMILARYIFNCAIQWEIPIEKNPTHGIDLYPVNNVKERYLTADEAKRLFAALEQSDSVMLPYIVKMLLLTGARKNEVLNARWGDFDLTRRIWTIEFNKSGKTRYVPLSDLTVALLLSLPRVEGCEFAFANPKTLKPYVQIFSSWDSARKKAGLSDVRIHDLRHSFASFLVNSGRSLYEVQKILGHTQVKTTQRYAHLSQDSLRSAANEVGRALDGVFAVKATETTEQVAANDSKVLERLAVLPKASGSK